MRLSPKIPLPFDIKTTTLVLHVPPFVWIATQEEVLTSLHEYGNNNRLVQRTFLLTIQIQ